ncbi:MAG: thioredoxin family protein [Lentisphaerota bacterium]
MKKTVLSLIVLFLAIVFYAQEPSSNTDTIPKLVDLGATKCIPCKKMAPILEELKTEYSGVFDVEFIDVWQKENSKKAIKYNIESIPTQVFLDKDGKELARHIGFISKEDILSQWKSLGYNFEPKSTATVTNPN